MNYVNVYSNKHIPYEKNRTRLDQRFVEKFATENKKNIPVTHVTIRQSISILLLKLVIVELCAAGLLVAFHTIFFTTNILQQFIPPSQAFNIPIFLVLVMTKTLIMFFIIFQWLDEFYEIKPKEIVYKRGFFFKHEEHHSLNHLVSLRVHQGVFGKLLNYGSLTMFNWATNAEFSLHLIHNPMKYVRILEYLMPEPDEEKEVVREHLFELSEEDESEE
jgi:hypothetical protein